MNGAQGAPVAGMTPPGQGGGVAGMTPPGQAGGFGGGANAVPPWMMPNTMAPSAAGSGGVQQQGLGVLGGGQPQPPMQPPMQSPGQGGGMFGGGQMPPGLARAPGLLGPAGQQQGVMDMLRRKRG